MRSTHLASSWAYRMIWLVMFILATAYGYSQGQTSSPGVEVRLKKVSFMAVVKGLAAENKIKLVVNTPVDAMVDLVDFPTPTPPEEILARLATSVGMEFWKDGDTCYIGRRKDVEATPVPATDLPEAKPTRTTLVTDTTARTVISPDGDLFTGETTVDTPNKPVIKRITLSYISCPELLWAMGRPGVNLSDAKRKRSIDQRIYTVLNPRRPNLKMDRNELENDMQPGAMDHTSPWLSNVMGRYNNGDSQTDGRQGGVIPPRGGNPGGGVRPGNPPGNGNNPGANTPGANPTRNLGNGPLQDFIPEGIQSIVGLIGLNALLVRADSEEDIDQLEQLIKLLDQPIKYVLVEAMFVKMEVKDAMSIGVSWEYAGMPWSVVSSNGGGEGNFAIRYVKGSLKAALSTLITNSQAKVINAPRVVVPNGGEGSVSITDSIPFVVVSEEQDVFGRTIKTPQIEMQDFQQSLDVASVTIHPDDTVSLEVSPQLSGPGAQVGIPGGAGAVSGSQDFEVETRLRIKSGETMMMGGFVGRNEAMGGSRDPLLANLPILGPLLFRNKTHSTNNTETLLFVTPTILKEDTTDFGGMQTLPPLF